MIFMRNCACSKGVSAMSQETKDKIAWGVVVEPVIAVRYLPFILYWQRSSP